MNERCGIYVYIHIHVHVTSMLILTTCLFIFQDLIHGAPIGKPVATRAKVTAVYGEEEDEEQEVHFTRM